MTISWRDGMDIGDPVIDADHHHLVEMINQFEAAIGGRIDHKAVARVLLGLVSYTGEHFQREEDLQLQVRYPYYDSHRRSHRDVLKHLNDLLARYVRLQGAERDAMIREMAGFLREWLVDHIISSDLRMKPYVQKFLADQAEAVRRQRAARALAASIAAGPPSSDDWPDPARH